MKNTKKFAAMIAALTLSACSIAPMAMTTASAAEGDVTIDIMDGTEKSTAIFKAYKILNATASKADTIADPSAKDAYNYTVNEKYESILITALGGKYDVEKGIVDSIDGLSDADMRTFADAVYKAIAADSSIEEDATSNGGSFEVPQGYYLIAQTAAADTATSLVMVDTADFEDEDGSIKINVKKHVPDFQKKLKDINDSTETEKTDWQDSADYDIGDKVPFQLKATLPDDYDSYDHYKLVFHDDLNKVGENNVFTLDESSFKVYVDKDGDGKYDTDEAISTASVATSGLSSSHASGFDCDFEVTIADLKATALASLGITKDMPIYVEYEATLNDNAALGNAGNWNDAYLEYSNNPYNTGSGNTDTTSKTPVDTVVVFTYKTVVDKIDKDSKPLTGATFKLEKFDASTNEWVEKTLVTATGGTSFSITGIDDGKYRLSETQAPTGFKQIDGYIEFTVTAEHITDGDKAELVLSSLTGNITNGEINIKNRDTVTNNMAVDADLTTLDADVINTSGSELPSTGGIGTTIFYLGGGAMVAVAGVFLITKKRMGKSEN